MAHQLVEQSRNPHQHVYQPATAETAAGEVPCGLTRCPVCGEFRGAVRNDDLPAECQREQAVVIVRCICSGVPCRTCGEHILHRPVSNYWDESRGLLVHRPWYSDQEPCDTCRTQQRH